MNILSESWDDSKMPLDQAQAHPTNLNAAIMAGSPPKKDGEYNGRFENLLRYHEQWNGSPAEIRGSFVNAWDSEIGVGIWDYDSDIYTALSRDWDYDIDFDIPGNLPPFTPKVTFLRRVVWLSR